MTDGTEIRRDELQPKGPVDVADCFREAAERLAGDADQPIGLSPATPSVADCVREARRRLEAEDRPELNAIVVGDRSVRLQGSLAGVRAAIERDVLADLGVSLDGPERPTVALHSTARNFASLDVLIETFWTWIEQQGVLTAKGKTRSAVTTLLALIDRQTKLANTIGLERKPRQVPGVKELLS